MSEQASGTGGSAAPARARLTPYELVVTERFEAEVFPKILSEANRHGPHAKIRAGGHRIPLWSVKSPEDRKR